MMFVNVRKMISYAQILLYNRKTTEQRKTNATAICPPESDTNKPTFCQSKRKGCNFVKIS